MGLLHSPVFLSCLRTRPAPPLAPPNNMDTWTTVAMAMPWHFWNSPAGIVLRTDLTLLLVATVSVDLRMADACSHCFLSSQGNGWRTILAPFLFRPGRQGQNEYE